MKLAGVRVPSMACRWLGRAAEKLVRDVGAYTLFATHYFELTQLPVAVRQSSLMSI